MFGQKFTAHKKSIYLLLIALLLFGVGCILHLSSGTYYYNESEGDPHVTGADDAYISYRYGWNLVHFNILSWNESGFRSTEGFTNPLWVYASAFWALLDNKDFVYPGMVITSMIITAVFIAGLSGIIIKNIKSSMGLFGIAILCLSPVIWLHSTSGLESSVFGGGLGLLAYFAITNDHVRKSDIWIGNILTLFIIFLRSDGFVYITVLLLGLFLAKRKNWLLVLPGLLIGFIVLLVWRAINFGQLYPNTQIAKLNFGLVARIIPGIVLYIKSMSNGGFVFIMTGLMGISYVSKPQRLASLVTLGGWSAYYVYIGGDLFLERHLLGVMFFGAALSGHFFIRIMQDKRGWILPVFLLLVMYVPFFVQDSRFLYLQQKPQDSWILIGKEMALQREKYGTTVTFPAGKIPFFAGGDFVDELGLNDPELAYFKRPQFVPGHSAGNHVRALEIAKQSSPVYSYFGFSVDLTKQDSQNVLLWANNQSPQCVVHFGMNISDFDIISKSNPFSYTLFFRGQ